MSEPDKPRSPCEQMRDDSRDIARVLLKEHPRRTHMSLVWKEALTPYRVHFETEVLPADSD